MDGGSMVSLRMLRRPAGTIEIHGPRFGFGLASMIGAGLLLLASPLAAQQRGPLPPPPGTVVPSAPPPKASAGPQDHVSHITNEPPSMPIEEIVQKFTQREEEFRKERDHFTYTQDVLFQ